MRGMGADFSEPAVGREFAALDFESAGVTRGATDVPVQVGWAVLRGGRIDEASLFRSYLRADRPVTWSARKVHGITDRDLEGAPRMLDLWPRFQAVFGGRVVVAHGRGTEQRFLRVFPGHRFGPWVDTVAVSRAVWPDLAGHHLEAAVAACGGESRLRSLLPGLTWHDALFDALACLVLVERLLELFPGSPLGALVHPDTGAHYGRRGRSARPGGL